MLAKYNFQTIGSRVFRQTIRVDISEIVKADQFWLSAIHNLKISNSAENQKKFRAVSQRWAALIFDDSEWHFLVFSISMFFRNIQKYSSFEAHTSDFQRKLWNEVNKKI